MNCVLGEPLPETLTMASTGAPCCAAALDVCGHEVTPQSAAPGEASVTLNSPAPQISPKPFL